jgi:hypothetical protein
MTEYFIETYGEEGSYGGLIWRHNRHGWAFYDCDDHQWIPYPSMTMEQFNALLDKQFKKITEKEAFVGLL